jgi:hypothetical protein
LKEPLRLVRRTDHWLELSFVEVPVLSVSLLPHEINIAANLVGECWDFLLSFDAFPAKTAAGYICRECPSECQTVFASRDALWRDHLFEPLLDWINTKLAAADAIGFYGRAGHSTWARLLPAKAHSGSGDPDILVDLPLTRLIRRSQSRDPLDRLKDQPHHLPLAPSCIDVLHA